MYFPVIAMMIALALKQYKILQWPLLWTSRDAPAAGMSIQVLHISVTIPI